MKTINLRYEVVRELPDHEGKSYLVRRKGGGELYMLNHLLPTRIFGGPEIRTLFNRSRMTVKKHISRYIDAGRILWINGEPVSCEGYFTVSPFFRGKTLADCREMQEEEVRKALVKVAYTLRELSVLNCRHPNLSPENIIVTEKGSVLSRPEIRQDSVVPNPVYELRKLLEDLSAIGCGIPDTDDAALALLNETLILESEPDAWVNDVYAEPTAWLLGIEHLSHRLMESIKYAGRDERGSVSIIGSWDNGLNTIIDELTVERQIAGNCVFDVTLTGGSSLFALLQDSCFIPGDTPEETGSGLVQLSLCHPLDIMIRIHPSAGEEEMNEIGNLFRMTSTGRIMVHTVSREGVSAGCPHTARLLHTVGFRDTIKQRLSSFSAGFPDFLPEDASPLECFQIFLQTVSGFSPDLNEKTPELAAAASVLQGVSLETALAVVEPGDESRLSEGKLYATKNVSGCRLWYHGDVIPGTETAEKLAETLLSDGCSREHEIRWLLDVPYGTPERKAEVFACFLKRNRNLMLIEQEISLLLKAAALFSVFDEETARRMILNNLWRVYGRTGVMGPLCEAIESNVGRSGRMDMVITLLKGEALKSSGDYPEAHKTAYRILAKNWSVEITEELVLAAGLFRGCMLRGDELAAAENILDRLCEWLQKSGDRSFLDSLLIIKATCHVWWGQKQKAGALIERISPPDENTDPHNAFIYYWLVSYITENTGDILPRIALSNMSRAYSIAMSMGIESAAIATLQNKALLKFRLGDITAPEALDEMQKTAEMSRQLNDDYQLVLSYADSLFFHLNLMNRHSTEEFVEKVAEHTDICPAYLLKQFAEKSVVISLLDGTPEDMLKHLRKIENERRNIDFSFPLSPLEQFLASPQDPKHHFKDESKMNVLAANLRLARGLCSTEEWIGSLHDLPVLKKDTPESLILRIRKGQLLDAYCILLRMLSHDIACRQFMQKRMRLLSALDIRYRRAGFVLNVDGHTPMETALSLTRYLEEKSTGKPQSPGNTVRTARGLSSMIASMIGLDYIWVLRKGAVGINVISSYPDADVSHRMSWIKEAVERADELSEPYIDLPGSGWSRGKPRSSVVVINISDDGNMEYSKNSLGSCRLFLVAEKVSPGTFLNDETLSTLMNFSGVLASLADIQSKKELLELDSLTGLLLRRSWLIQSHSAARKADTRPSMVAVIDVDRFGSINSTSGHGEGDRVLREIAAVIRKNLREIDIIGHYGDDEFTAFVMNITSEVSFRILERIRKAVNAEVALQDSEVTVSIGYAMMPDDADTFSLAFLQADTALRYGKSHGRNRVTAAKTTLKGRQEPAT